MCICLIFMSGFAFHSDGFEFRLQMLILAPAKYFEFTTTCYLLKEYGQGVQQPMSFGSY